MVLGTTVFGAPTLVGGPERAEGEVCCPRMPCFSSKHRGGSRAGKKIRQEVVGKNARRHSVGMHCK